MARTLGTLTSIVLALALAGCGSSQHGSSDFGPQGASISLNGPAPQAPDLNPPPTCNAPSAPVCVVAVPCPAPAPCPASVPSDGSSPVPASDGSGDGSSSSSDTSSSDGSVAESDTSQTAAPAPGLVVEVTNTSDVTIDVTAQTSDESVDLGAVAPGETVSCDLGEVPTSVDMSATATSPDESGVTPTFEPDTIDLGSDYTDQAPVATIDWEDPSASDTSSTDTSAEAPSHAASSVYVAHTAPFARAVRRVTPRIVHRTLTQ